MNSPPLILPMRPMRPLRRFRLSAKQRWTICLCCFVTLVLFLDYFDLRKLNTRSLDVDPDDYMKGLYDGDLGCTSREHKLVYVHLPKTGGTTIENLSLFDDGKPFHRIGGHYPVETLLRNSHVRDMDDFVTAATIRHPCERYISAFYYLKKNRGNHVDIQWAKDHIGDMSIDEFTLKQKENDWKDIRMHFRPMTSYMMLSQRGAPKFGVDLFQRGAPKFGVDEVLCQEHWDEGITRLFDHANIEAPEYLFNSGKTNNYEAHALHNKHEHCADLDPKTRAIIEEHYAMDYCLFEYPPLPEDPETSTCIGKGKDKAYFTKRYRVDCKKYQ